MRAVLSKIRAGADRLDRARLLEAFVPVAGLVVASTAMVPRWAGAW